MKNFIKYTLASMLGMILLLFILLFIGIGIGSSQEEPVQVKENSVLKVTLNKIVEREPLNPFADFNFGGKEESNLVGLNKILQVIENAKSDSRIKGLYLDAGTFNGGGIATVEAVRKALVDFRTSGKFIYSYAEYYTQKSYYIASVADKIYLNPAGAVDIKGLGAQLMFFKNAMDKFGVDMQIIRGPNNKFKSAVEPFMYDKMSEANREQMKVFMHSIWDDMVKQMATDRNISISDFNTIADSLWVSDPQKAKELHIVDELSYYDQVQDVMLKKMEVEKSKDIHFISMGDYASTIKKKNVSAKKKIAIIYAVGEIQSGEGNDEVIGSDRIAKAVAKARQDSSIKAIVLRVNSPGGSALASEVMWRELVLAKKDKPLVVSMGDYAASGGYYISCMADKIVAQPTTLTGSIGVFGMIPNIQKLLNEKIGITTDEVSTNANSVVTINKPLTPFQIKSIQKGVVNIYTTFINHVAEGRGMTPEQVDNIGQGRVWSGANAVKIGLVDELGGIQKAIDIAAKMADVTEYKTVEYPSRKNPIEEIIKQLSNNTSASAAIKTELGDNYKYYNYLKKIQSMKGVQARLPFFIEMN